MSVDGYLDVSFFAPSPVRQPRPAAVGKQEGNATTEDQHHTTPEEWGRLKAEQARDDWRWRRRRGRGEGTRPRTFRHDLWDWLVGWGSGLLGGALILFGAASISNTLDGNGLVASDVGSYAICGAVTVLGLWFVVAAFRRWDRSGV